MDVTRPLFLVVLLAATFGASAGQVYKWVDPNGKVRFSDMPQVGWKRVDPATGAAIESNVNIQPQEELEDPEGEAEGAAGGEASPASPQVASKPPSPALKAQECKRRQEQLANYQKANRVITQDALGAEKEYSEIERLQLIERTQSQVKELCG